MKLLFIGGPLDGQMLEIDDVRMYFEAIDSSPEALDDEGGRRGVTYPRTTKVRYVRRIIQVIDTAVHVFATNDLTPRDILQVLIDSYCSDDDKDKIEHGVKKGTDPKPLTTHETPSYLRESHKNRS